MNGNHFDIHDLKREYEKGRKQGAVEELKEIIGLFECIYKGNEQNEILIGLKLRLEKRLLELK